MGSCCSQDDASDDTKDATETTTNELSRHERTASEIHASERVKNAETQWIEEQAKNEEATNKLEAFVRLSTDGVTMIKHGRRGKPHERLVSLDWNAYVIRWQTSELSLHEGFAVKPGKCTSVFQKRSSAKSANADTCFSVICASRTVDLQCKTMEERDLWVYGLEQLSRKADEAVMKAKSTS